jgi:hypothetical protein
MSRQVIVRSKTGSRGTGRLVRHRLAGDEKRTACGRAGWTALAPVLGVSDLMEHVHDCGSCARSGRT